MKQAAILLGFCVIASLCLSSTCRATELKGVEIHGFISQGYLKSDENDFIAETKEGTFEFNELAINFSSDLTDKLGLGIQFFSHDFGDIGKNDVIIDWALGDYRWKDWLGLRIGKIKVPIGFYNETRDIDSLRTAILLPQSVYPEQYRENILALQGVGIYGDILMGAAGNISYQLQYGTSDVDSDSGVSRVIEVQGPFEVDDIDTDDAWVAALKWETPLNGLKLGASMVGTTIDIHYHTTYDMPIGFNPMTFEPIVMPAGTPMAYEVSRYRWNTYSLEYIWENLTLSAEYATTEMRGKIDTPMGLFSEMETDSEGYYASAAFRFTEWFELGGYYSVYYPNRDDKDGDEVQPPFQKHSAWVKDLAITTRFDINLNWTFKFEGHSMDGTAMTLSNENTEEDWFLFAAKMTFTF